MEKNNLMIFLKTYLFFCFFSILLFSNSINATNKSEEYIKLIINSHEALVEVAKTEQKRQKGLMYKKSLRKDEGMIFKFRKKIMACMWMKNTLIPLSVAFIDEKQRIINIEKMKPNTYKPHCSKKLALYALEMNINWFEEKKILKGSIVVGLNKILIIQN